MTFSHSPRLKFIPPLLLAFLIAACGSTPAEPDAGGDKDGILAKEQDSCAQPLDFGIFEVESAGRIASLGEQFQPETLGQHGALELAAELFSLEDSFCGLEVPEAVSEALDEIDRLYETGQVTLADEKLNELINRVKTGTFSTNSYLKTAMGRLQQGGVPARKAVRTYLAIAARAQYWGNDERADNALDSARQTYETWASETIENTTLKEALTIAAEAQLLGLDELGDEAIARATDLTEADLVEALEAFEPCLASVREARRLMRTAAIAMLLGVEAHEYGFDDEFETWLDIYQRRQRGEAVPECEAWQVKPTLDTQWGSGNHNITWEGFFTVLEDGTLDGQGSGSLSTHVETTCVNLASGEQFTSTTDVTGSFSFEIQGKQEAIGGEQVFKFQFPAKVTLSGEDSCNPFDPTTYLPKFVIEEIHGSGGVEGYDMASDQIYLVAPAMDGATKEYETVIGPVTLTLKAPVTSG